MEILFCLLQRDDLSIEEIIVWDHLIKWGIEQTLGLENTLPKNSSLRKGLLTKIKLSIIKPNLANIIFNWIDKKDIMYIRTINDPVYKFDLIYRDGINNETFKDYCNGRVASLVLIKVQNSNEIFGGYSSIGFNSIGDSYFVEFGYL
ncbi:hypothetical protein C1646_755474 [Rhizophagus diaphanus]|nr:hypothetical protein C1646_755474 [Rhizophagus diaphanus] [Rhizophagus sp. MUCL 43196]